MEVIIIILFFVGIPVLLFLKLKKEIQQKRARKKQKKIKSPTLQPIIKINNYSAYYQRKMLFTKNEYFEFIKLVSFAKANRLEVLAKVRLLDLIEPRTEHRRSKTFLYKIQAKHVDFVITDVRYNVVAIVELDDSSHDRPDRIERDRFVDEVLKGVGYNVIHTRSITNEVTQTIYNIAYAPAAQPGASEAPGQGVVTNQEQPAQ